MDRDELELFTNSLRGAADRHAGAALDAAYDDLGWRDALQDDQQAIAALFAIQGGRGVASSAIDDVLLSGLGLEPVPERAVVMPPLGRHDAAYAGRTVDGFATHRASTATELVIVGEPIRVVPAPALDRRQVSGIDPASGWVAVSGHLDGDETISGVWPDALALGHRAVATELAALGRTMLGLARDHAADRVQFGRAIGSFQAVRHKLADALLATEAADAAVSVGWAEPSGFTALMAKAIAGRSGRTVARHAQQVLAGMGFTAEHGFHLLMKRSMVLDQVLGSGAALSSELAQRSITERVAPPMLAL
ncbi:MAG: hypothetical protein JO246_13365 [Frankiaceae bacterium]|nr:hypothetical protein [Frankiaceae bacterium]MBV9872474.1 hypothetical protein [Frankiaceae bacterium]